MPLTQTEQEELRLLIARTTAKDGKLRQDADTKDLERIQELFDRAEDSGAEPPPGAPKLKGRKPSPEAQRLIDAGAQYLGAEPVNFGTHEKPRWVIRELLYQKDGDGKQEAVMVQEGRSFTIGRKIADNALRRLTK